jgi:hypothetical protein
MLKEFHPISELDAKMDPKVLKLAHKLAKRESLKIKLSALRNEQGLKQSDVPNFTQTAVSKIENRKDIKVSTLIDYLDSLGMGLEISAFPKNQVAKKEVLLRI